MKRRLILITLAAVLLVGGLNLLARGGWISGKAQEYVLKEARRGLGYEVGVDRVVFNFFPSYVDIKRPYVKGWDASAPGRTLGADNVRVYFSLAGLLGRRLQVSRVYIFGPALDAVRLPGGGYNFDALKERLRRLSEGGGREKKGAVTVKEVVVYRGRFSYRDLPRGVFVYAGDTAADFRLMGGGEYRLGWKVKDAVLRRGGFPPFRVGLAGDMRLKGAEVRLDALRVESGRSSLGVSGRVVLAERPKLDVKVKGALELGLLDRLALTRGGPTGEVGLEGMVKGTYPDLTGSGKLTLRRAEYAGVKLDDLASKVEVGKGGLTMPDIESRLLGGRLEGSVRVEFGRQVSYVSDWKFRDIVTGNYTQGRKGLEFIPWQTLSGAVRIAGAGLKARDAVVSGSIEAAKYLRPHPAEHVSRELDILRSARVDYRIRDGVISVDRGSVSSKYSTVEFTGTVKLDGASDLAIKGRSTNIVEIATLIGYSDIKGSLDLTAYMKGNITEPEIYGKAQITEAAAHGIPFRSAYGGVKLSGWQLSFDEFTINQERASSFILNGKIMFRGPKASFDEPYFTARLGVRKADVRKIIAMVYEDIPVNLVADGEMSFDGNTRNYTGEARLAVGQGDVYGQPVDKGEVSATLNEKGLTFPRVVAVRGKDIVTASGGIGFDDTFYGKATSARVDAASFKLLMDTGFPVRGNFSVSVSGEGSFKSPDIRADVGANRLYIKDLDIGGGEAQARIRNSALTVGGSLMGGKVKLSGALGLSAPYAWRGALSFDESRFEPFMKLLYKDLPEDVTLVATGTLSGEGELDKPSRTALSADFRRFSANVMGRRLDNDGDMLLRYRDGRLSVRPLRLKGESVKVELSGDAEGEMQVDAALKVDADLDVVKPFIKDSVDYIAGKGQADIRIRGGLANPALSGLVRLSGAGIKFRGFPQRFEQIRAEVRLEKEGFRLASFEADAGGGKVRGTGRGDLKGLAVDSFSFDMELKGIRVRYPEGVNSTIDADVSFEGAGGKTDLSGDVVVKKGRYAERIDWKSWLVSIQKRREEVEVGGGSALSDTNLDLHIAADESIRIENNLAKIPVSADLTLRGTVSEPVILGRLEATSGSVYFRNNEFRLINGVAEFADPRRLNPIIDLQAETKVREYTIQLTLSGTVDRLKVSLLSDPPLEDSDILALLTLGRTSEAVKGHEAAISTGEATSFVTGQIQDAVESRLKRITGFDRFQIDPYLTSTGASSGPRLTIGKSLLSDKLYLTYSSNVGTSEDQYVRLEYIFNKNLSLVGERDEVGHYGADLKFRFEFR